MLHFKRTSRVLSVEKTEEKGERILSIATELHKLHPTKGWRRKKRGRETVKVNADNWGQKPYVGMKDTSYEAIPDGREKPRPSFVSVEVKEPHKYRRRWKSAA